MNRPSRTDEPPASDGYNQSPPQFSNDLTTNQDLNGISNTRTLRREQDRATEDSGRTDSDPPRAVPDGKDGTSVRVVDTGVSRLSLGTGNSQIRAAEPSEPSGNPLRVGNRRTSQSGDGSYPGHVSQLSRVKHAIITFGKFIGPGFMVAVAYSTVDLCPSISPSGIELTNPVVDPGNYATDVAAGASYRFRLLFIVLLSNIFAIFLQSLSIKLGTVSGLNLAEACRAFLPRWLNYALYVMAEAAIIATDIAEVRDSGMWRWREGDGD